MGKPMRAIGLMSGTSMDGIDVALIDTDGEDFVQRGPSATFPYSDALRVQIRAALADAATIKRREERPGRLAILEQHLTDLHAEAVQQFAEDYLIELAEIDVIGFHGQTVLHRASTAGTVTPRHGNLHVVPSPTLTVQLGDGVKLAQSLGCDVVFDMRADDCAAGGQGAPLVPVYHRALVAGLPQRPVAIVNVGGVANVTWIGRNGGLRAFDTGPGNAMIDDWMQKETGHPQDPDGRMAAQGQVHADRVASYLSHPYFAAAPPKSLDRNAFALDRVMGLSTADGAATLTAFAAEAIARARMHMPEEPELWIIAGGGRKNRTLMGMLAGQVASAVAPAEAAGLNGDTIEAEAWAYLAVRSLQGLPITFPETTGVSTPQTGGLLARAGSET